MPLAEDLADPDMFGHLWPDLEPGAAWAEDEGPGAADDPADELDPGAWDACAEGVAVVEALAMVSPYARVAPSAAAPTAVPIRGLLILMILLAWSAHRAERPGAGR